MIGLRFGRLVVLARADDIGGRDCWGCVCECGSKLIVGGNSLRTGNTKSCGCLQRDRAREFHTTHGKCKSKEWNIWQLMKKRCYWKKCERYANYGGRGIKVCKRWRESFEAFLKDMGPCPPGLTLDRENNNGNYEPGNCRWATHVVQANNRSNNRIITIGNVSKTVSQWARQTGIGAGVIRQRLHRGASDWEALKPITRARF